MGRGIPPRSVATSAALVVAATVAAALALRAWGASSSDIVAMLAILDALAVVWLAGAHLATAGAQRGSLARQFAAGSVAAVALVLVSVVAGMESMFVSRHDARVLLVLLGFSLVVSMRIARLFAASAAGHLARLGRALATLARREETEPIAETGPAELAAVAASANAMARDLRAAEAEAAAADRARRELVAAVSHDLRTPLAALSLLVDAIADGVVTSPEEVAEYQARMRVHLRHLMRLVDDLFELARLEAGDVRFAREAVAVPEFVGETVEAFRPRAEARALTLADDVEAAVPAVAASPERLQRVLFNLLENAVEHTPAGGEVRLTARRDDGAVAFEVADSGAGISARDAVRVFDRFYRGGDDASRPAGGAGLGLAIARAIVEAHGGTIWVANPGEPGARVRFTVPAA
jgi:two-component system, OmpR family, sensor histidine kinase SaeS